LSSVENIFQINKHYYADSKKHHASEQFLEATR